MEREKQGLADIGLIKWYLKYVTLKFLMTGTSKSFFPLGCVGGFCPIYNRKS